MIEGRLIFSQAKKWAAFAAFLRLPANLRPDRVSTGEDDVGEPIDADRNLLDSLGWRSGFSLNGPNVSYSISTSDPKWIVCDCFLKIQKQTAEMLLIDMAQAQPTFAYLCDPMEEEARNRISNTVGVNTIESWVGRDVDRYVPGLYWLTLLSDALAAKHGVPIAAVANTALQHVDLGGQHLFRFYENPSDWSLTEKVPDLCSSTPGIFDIDDVRSRLVGKDTLMSYTDITRAWR